MDLTDVIGNFGKIQKRVLGVLFVRSLALSSVGYITHFATLNVQHWCSPQNNFTALEWRECCIPKDGQGYSRCHYYDLFANQTFGNETKTECNSWHYDEEESHLSAVSEWDLVCDRRWQISLLFSMYSFGNFIAYGPSGIFADRFGRRPSVLFGSLVVTVCTFLSAFSTSATMLAVLRFITGLGYPFIQHVILSLYMEMTGRKERVFTQFVYNGAWGMGTTIQAGISLAVPNWRRFILISAFPIQLLFLILVAIGLPESPRWLLATRRYEKAEKAVEKFASINGIVIVNRDSVMQSLKQKVETVEGVQKDEKNVQLSSFRDFTKSKRLLAVALILYFINISKAFLGNGFSITLRHFGGTPQISFLVYGVTGMFSSVLFEGARACLHLRRASLIACYAISGAMFITIIFISNEYYWLKLSLAMVGNTVRKVASASLYLIVSEIFPTNMRGRGIAIYMTAGRLGNLLAPLTDLLAYRYGINSSLILFSCICLMLSVLISFLPETQNFLLPDSVKEADKTVRDANNMWKKQNKKDNARKKETN